MRAGIEDDDRLIAFDRLRPDIDAGRDVTQHRAKQKQLCPLDLSIASGYVVVSIIIGRPAQERRSLILKQGAPRLLNEALRLAKM